MHVLVNRRARSLLLVGVALLSSCVSAEQSVAPTPLPATTEGHMVISQVYGGGGNSGATYKNDFIELYNNSNAVVTLTGWSVQYASSAGTTWQTTALSGTLQPGQYYLVQEAVGAGGTVNLPAPDATGIIAMSATAGKVALVSNVSALSGACPVAVEDIISYGTTVDNSCEGTAAPTLTNTTAASRATTARATRAFAAALRDLPPRLRRHSPPRSVSSSAPPRRNSGPPDAPVASPADPRMGEIVIDTGTVVPSLRTHSVRRLLVEDPARTARKLARRRDRSRSGRTSDAIRPTISAAS